MERGVAQKNLSKSNNKKRKPSAQEIIFIQIFNQQYIKQRTGQC